MQLNQPTFALAFFLLAVAALGAETDDCKSYDEWCETNIADAEFQAADTELNRAYRNLSKALSEKQRKALVASQRSWINFRHLDCTVQYSLIERGPPAILQGSMLGCMNDRTVQRTLELKAFCVQVEGCVAP